MLLILFIASLCIMSLNSCKKCKIEEPRARIINNGTKVADVQIKTSNGNTVNINGISPGVTSEYKSFAAGDIIFTINIDKNTIVTAQMEECFESDITIDSNNNVILTLRDRNE